MQTGSVYCAGGSRAIRYAEDCLKKRSIHVTQEPDRHTAHVLLDVPSFHPDRNLISGRDLNSLLDCLPPETVIWGGNLREQDLKGHSFRDLLRDEDYLAANAAITAECAIRIAGSLMPAVWSQIPTLVIGWGRIGKCLGRLLRSLDCPVTVAARNPVHRACLRSLGYAAADIPVTGADLGRFRLIYNTVPEPVIGEEQASHCTDCIKIDLASRKGIAGPDVIWARGLPGIHAPESSGRLIAETFVRKLQEELS